MSDSRVGTEPLGHQLIRERLVHLEAQSLLFTGPEGVGRRMLAAWYTRALNCEQGFPPCGRCASCRMLHHPDYLEIQPAQRTRTGGAARRPMIRVEQIVERRDGERDVPSLTNWLETRPRFKAKIIVIDGAHWLGEAAANTLLKLLEEPPAYAHLILIAPSRERILPTLASRCLELRFGRVPDVLLAPFTSDPAILAYAEGAPGRLFAVLADPRGLHNVISLISRFMGSLEHPGELFEVLGEMQDAVRSTFEPWPHLREALADWPPQYRLEALSAIAELREALEAYVNETLAWMWFATRMRRVNADMHRRAS